MKQVFYREMGEKMENIEIVGQMSIKSGDFAKEVTETLINAGFLIARIGCTKTETQFEVSKKIDTK